MKYLYKYVLVYHNYEVVERIIGSVSTCQFSLHVLMAIWNNVWPFFVACNIWCQIHLYIITKNTKHSWNKSLSEKLKIWARDIILVFHHSNWFLLLFYLSWHIIYPTCVVDISFVVLQNLDVIKYVWIYSINIFYTKWKKN